jgi:small subunit ribosomal protein S2
VVKGRRAVPVAEGDETAEDERIGASMASIISLKALLVAGVLFGHRTHKWDPKMKPFIFTERNGVHIIDLQQTVSSLTSTYNMVRELVANGGILLFVGTKSRRRIRSNPKRSAAACRT